MRISVCRDDPGYSPDTHRYDVTVDGRVVTSACFAADEALGEARCYRRGAGGKFVIDATGTALETEVLRGTVQIVLRGREGLRG